jgi:glycosyltransferase involved in cell wall biosynthesis
MMPQIYNMADIFLVSLKNEKVFKETVPGKIQSYMMYGKPILGIVSGDSKNLILDAKCGFVAKPGSYRNFIYILNKILVMKKASLDKIGRSGKKFALKNFDSNISMLKLENHFKNLL